MVEIMLADNTNVSSAAILPISNGIVLFTNVKHANKQHPDTHHEHVMDAFLMTEFVAIMTLKENMMEILLENVRSSIIVCTYLFAYCSKVERFCLLFFLPLLSHFSNQLFKMFLPPNSRFNPIIYPSTNKPYPPVILVKNSTWFLRNADLFICREHILYGVHQSHFNQSPLFREIITYGKSNAIGTNPYHPIPFDTLTKEVFHNLLYLMYFGTDHLDYLAPEDWLNVKCLCTDCTFPILLLLLFKSLLPSKDG
jgi:hypothetical protein